MPTDSVHGVRIAGIAAAVPSTARPIACSAEVFGEEQVNRIAQSTGVRSRREASNRMCTSDLCLAAAENLIAELGWPREEITGLVFVSQTPDYILPATSCSLHGRLGLSSGCYAFDVNLGCSGYVYGLWIASRLLHGRENGKVLLLVGDTITRITSPQDRSVALLFGDAGTATAIESAPEAPPFWFDLGTDGSGAKHLIVPAGLFRQPRDEKTSLRTLREGDNIRSDEDLFMDGAEVFAFTLQRVPALLQRVLSHAGESLDNIDAFVPHQANRFMLQHLAKRMKIPASKLVLTLEEYGNTSSASIPLTIVASDLGHKLKTSSQRLLLAGFGVGFSWGAAVVNCGPMAVPELVELKDAHP
jgi:3-oxoacyl-[acyl-carrier-protein] synthase III